MLQVQIPPTPFSTFKINQLPQFDLTSNNGEILLKELEEQKELQRRGSLSSRIFERTTMKEKEYRMLYVSNDELIQRLTIKAVESSPEFCSYKNAILKRIGCGSNDDCHSALIDEMSEIASAIANLPDTPELDLCGDLCKKYGKIKEKILSQMTEHPTRESIMATA